jgi:hypothetical protein
MNAIKIPIELPWKLQLDRDASLVHAVDPEIDRSVVFRRS